MKTKIFTLVLMLAFSMICPENAWTWNPMLENRALTGQIEVTDSHFYLTTENQGRFELQSLNFKIEGILRSLQSGDVIRTTTLASSDPKILIVESVDFVGLKRLLGRWIARSGPTHFIKNDLAVMDFVDFSHLSILLPESRAQFQYTIAPKGPNSWRFFFTDESSVQLGELIIEETAGSTNVEVHFFHPQTGELTKNYQLEKIQGRP